MAHSFLPPSGASAWSRCALWPSMAQRYPELDTVASLEGTAAHWVVTEPRKHTEGETTPHGVLVTAEMIEGAAMMWDMVTARLNGNRNVHAETPVSIPQIHPDCFGTPDIWAWDAEQRHLEIFDYKFGHGFVDEYFNLQGLLYALGILNSLNVVNVAYVSVAFTIVQPRCYHRGEPVRTHEYLITEATAYIEDLVAAAGEAYAPVPMAVTGSHCEHCAGRHACPTLQRAAYSAAEFADRRQPFDLEPAAAALELRMLENALAKLEARVESLRELTLVNIKRGANVPHYRAEAGKGRAAWNVPDEQIIAMGTMFGHNLSKTAVITPTQAKKLGIDEAVITAYSMNKSGSVKLIPQNNEDASRVFGRK